MAGRIRRTNIPVFVAALERFRSMYRAGHRVMVTCSGGKDSTVCVELAVMAATMENRLPVEVVFQDDEIGLPPTHEYLRWLAEERPEIKFYWMLTKHPVVNLCNRDIPYFWSFDRELDPEQWIRKPPPYAIELSTQEIDDMILPGRFPPAPGTDLINVQGLRTQESQTRKLAILSANSFITKVKPRSNVRAAYPIYDWTEKDVWTFINNHKFRYNTAYDAMVRLGVSPRLRRIGPITMNSGSIQTLTWACSVWPEWAERVFTRLPGTRSVARYGVSAILPHRKVGETWKQAFHRLCIDEAPAWIAERATEYRDTVLKAYQDHTGVGRDLPEIHPPPLPLLRYASWKKLTLILYDGDPIGMKIGFHKMIDPGFFRPGAGAWCNPDLIKQLKKLPVQQEVIHG